jgi:exonuclease SbcD
MRILHTSDWHLGKNMTGVWLYDDQQYALDQILAHLASAPPYDLMLVAGDVFDRVTPSERAVRMLGDWLARARNIAPQLPIVFIAGNHDNGPRLAWTSALLDQQHVFLRGEIDGVDRPIEVTARDGSQAQVWALPFLLPGAGGEDTPSQALAIESVVGRIRASWDRSQVQVLVAHCYVRDGKTSESERSIGTANLVEPDVFEGFDYVALGHLHRPQSAAPNARYSGAISRYSFSEAGGEKSMAAIEVTPGQPHRFTPVALKCLRGMHRITDTLQALLTDPKYADRLQDYVELTLDPPVDVGNPHEQLRTRWAHPLSFRNEVGGEGASQALLRTGGDKVREMVEDFEDFYDLFPPGLAPPEQVLATFRRLEAVVIAEEARNEAHRA